jgi:hypothetical protein
MSTRRSSQTHGVRPWERSAENALSPAQSQQGSCHPYGYRTDDWGDHPHLAGIEVGYKVLQAEMLKRIAIESSRFGIEPKITVKLAKLGCRIYSVAKKP